MPTTSDVLKRVAKRYGDNPGKWPDTLVVLDNNVITGYDGAPDKRKAQIWSLQTNSEYRFENHCEIENSMVFNDSKFNEYVSLMCYGKAAHVNDKIFGRIELSLD